MVRVIHTHLRAVSFIRAAGRGYIVTRMFPSETHCTEAAVPSARVRPMVECTAEKLRTYKSAFRHLKRHIVLLCGNIFFFNLAEPALLFSFIKDDQALVWNIRI